MFERYLLKTIHLDESVVKIVRPSWIHYRWKLAFVFVGLVITVFLFYPLFSLGSWGGVIFFILVAFFFFALLRIFILWSLNVYILTSKRIIDVDQRSLFEKHVAECPLENIQDIRYNKKGFFSTVFNVGTVIVQSGGGRGHIDFVDVPNPNTVKESIMNVQQHHSRKQVEEQ